MLWFHNVFASNPSAVDRLLDSVADCLNRESAERLARLQISPETLAKIEKLAERANEGILSDTDLAEYLEYVEAMDFVAILQSKASNLIR